MKIKCNEYTSVFEQTFDNLKLTTNPAVTMRKTLKASSLTDVVTIVILSRSLYIIVLQEHTRTKTHK